MHLDALRLLGDRVDVHLNSDDRQARTASPEQRHPRNLKAVLFHQRESPAIRRDAGGRADDQPESFALSFSTSYTVRKSIRREEKSTLGTKRKQHFICTSRNKKHERQMQPFVALPGSPVFPGWGKF